VARRVARFDPSLRAVVKARRSLSYDEGASEAEDRPAHVRAASAAARVGSTLVVVQDDAGFVALVDLVSGATRAVPLPRGPGGARQFDDRRGNKKRKLDLEACVIDGSTVVAFGSGSTPERERIILVENVLGPSPAARVHDAGALYAELRRETSFSGSELNVEGAVLAGDRLVLFQRGNGAPRGGLEPVDATCELPWRDVRAYLLIGAPPPPPERVVRYDLGSVGGVRLTFTDAALAPSGAIVFLAAAERSPDATSDGPVVGVALGVLAGGQARMTLVRDGEQAPLLSKAEGIVLEGSKHAWLVVDTDDPDAPAELLDVSLAGFAD
jgi:hypothetical protein